MGTPEQQPEQERTAPVPGFATPPTRLRQPDPALPPEEEPDQPSQPETEPEETEPERPGLAERFRRLISQRPETPGGDTPCPTSSPASGKPRQKLTTAQATIAVAGLLGIGFGLAAAGIRRRTGQRATLRQPTREEIGDMAEPLASILLRHVPAKLLHPDLADALATAEAVQAYALAGPVLIPHQTHTEEVQP